MLTGKLSLKPVSTSYISPWAHCKCVQEMVTPLAHVVGWHPRAHRLWEAQPLEAPSALNCQGRPSQRTQAREKELQPRESEDTTL
jgi:hypothetical protein